MYVSALFSLCWCPLPLIPVSRYRKVNKCYRGRSCPIIVHCRCVAGGLWGAGGGGRGQDGRAQVEVPGLVPSSNLPLWSYTLVHVSQTHCLPVPLMPGDDQQPMGEVSISRFR